MNTSIQQIRSKGHDAMVFSANNSPTNEPDPGFNSGTSGQRDFSEYLPQEIGDYVRRVESFLNQCSHAVSIFRTDAQVIFRNRAAIRLTQAEELSPAGNAWETVGKYAERVVADALRNHSAEFSVVFPIQQRCFCISGSLVRNESDRIIGAIANFSEVHSVPQLPSASPSPCGANSTAAAKAQYAENGDPSLADESQFQRWLNRRADARRRMQKLSRRETQVANMVSLGKANKIIARELDISVKTIEKHRANAVRKLGVSSTPEMVRIAVIAEDNLEDPIGSPAQLPKPTPTSFGGAAFSPQQN
ncbi:MAG: LuxR C-terminal-related transcriptional regulator [Planctomycetaceae bacterium]